MFCFLVLLYRCTFFNFQYIKQSVCIFFKLVANAYCSHTSPCCTNSYSAIFLSADEASEGRSYNVTARPHRLSDRNHLLQSAWALRDPQGVLRRTFAPRPAVEPPPEGRGPLPETGEEKGADKWRGRGGSSLCSVCVPVTAETSLGVTVQRSPNQSDNTGHPKRVDGIGKDIQGATATFSDLMHADPKQKHCARVALLTVMLFVESGGFQKRNLSAWFNKPMKQNADLISVVMLLFIILNADKLNLDCAFSSYFLPLSLFLSLSLALSLSVSRPL